MANEDIANTDLPEDFDFEKAYWELESKNRETGDRLGEFEEFFNNVTPLLEKLDENPELVQGIIDGKIDQQLAQAILDDRIDVLDAEAVTQASKEVKKELGKKGAASLSAEEITKLVEEKADLIRKELEEKSEIETFEERTRQFIEKTEDFMEYAPEIDEWLDEHDVTDIEVAYYAVKGRKSEDAARAEAEAARAEANQEMVANAQGGGVYSTTHPESGDLADQLIAGPINPLY